MKLVEGRKIEDCFDEGLKFGYRLDGGIVETLMRELAADARLDFHPDFPRPFFKIFRKDGLQITGILGGCDIEVYFPKSHKEEHQAQFEMELRRLASILG
jgi:hypothetical protein